MIPKVLKNINLFVNGTSYLGRVAELTLPKLTLKTEEARFGGMDAPVSIDMGMEALTAEMTVAGQDALIAGLFGYDYMQFTFRGAFQDQNATMSVVATMTGKIKENDPGTWKPGDQASGQLKCTIAVNAYTLQVNGITVHEIDVENMKRIIAGVDQLATQRAALGLGGSLVSSGINLARTITGI
jgi:P2 family phage contractile tail tube protein